MRTAKPAAPLWTDPDDLDNNTSGNPTIGDVLAARMHRRHVLKGGVGAIAAASLGTLGLSACGTMAGSAGGANHITLGFKAVSKSLMDRVTVPEGYTATVVYATGDPLDAALPDYKNDGSDDNFARRAGDHHDGIHYFGLSAAGAPDNSTLDRALLVMNHENITGTAKFIHVGGQTNMAATSGPRPESEVVKEIDAHGVSVVEVRRVNGKYSYIKSSGFNRRITGATPMELSGPARGSAYTKTCIHPAAQQRAAPSITVPTGSRHGART